MNFTVLGLFYVRLMGTVKLTGTPSLPVPVTFAIQLEKDVAALYLGLYLTISGLCQYLDQIRHFGNPIWSGGHYTP